ncbi:hypothetical protein QJS10_CPA07g00492 [Acorus calamus]|uniref:Uncharacterized protein n=1 Tax=Acorus calamus TaxID=4465 RepID=A0AAV9EGP3_ACOCL|nr:hypothetical protein QJS10_CPA07g00492 [Acorus calamus]
MAESPWIVSNQLFTHPQDHLLIREEHAARSSYLHLLSEEESFARQKSRQNFIQLGDRNTAYFYAAHAAHKASNTFRKVQRLDGSFSENAKDVRDEAIAFYQNLLNRENQAEVPDFPLSSRLTSLENAAICKPVQQEEIFLTLRSMKGSSSPGPDDSNPTSAFTLRYLFLDFSNWSGLHLNTSKSQLFLGVAPANTSFSQIIDIEHAPLPTKYLGLPLKA